MKPTRQLHDLEQSLWLDNITRDLVSSKTVEHRLKILSMQLPTGYRAWVFVGAPLTGDPNASIPNQQPEYYRPMFGAFGRSMTESSVIFVSQAALDPFLSDNPSRDNGWSGYLTGKNSTQGGDR